MRPNAYLLDWGDDWEIIDDAAQLEDEYIQQTAPHVTALECLRGFDHGARTAEELDMDRCADGAARIMSPMLALMLPAGAPWHPFIAEELAMAYIVEEYRVERSEWSGLWHCDDSDDAQELYELWDYTIEPALGDAGYIVETNTDCSMTWIYRPMEGEQ